MSPIVQPDPEAANYPYLRGGIYGPGMGGQDHEQGGTGHDAKATIIAWTRPAETIPDFGRFKGKKAEDFMHIELNVFSHEYGMCRLFEEHPISVNSGSRELIWVAALGITMSDSGAYDTDDLIGMDCIVAVGDPYQSGEQSNNPGKWNTGSIRGLFAIA